MGRVWRVGVVDFACMCNTGFNLGSDVKLKVKPLASQLLGNSQE